jgi:hypothetical protein
MREKYFFKALLNMQDEAILLYVHESKPIEYLIMKKGIHYDVFEQRTPMIIYKRLLHNASYHDVVSFFQ